MRQCPGCVRLRVEAKTLEAVMEQREAQHREQQEIALEAILLIMAELGSWRTGYGNIDNAYQGKLKRICAERNAADKALQSYVKSFDTFKSSLRAILDRERDGRLAPADIQELREMVR